MVRNKNSSGKWRWSFSRFVIEGKEKQILLVLLLYRDLLGVSRSIVFTMDQVFNFLNTTTKCSFFFHF